MAARVLLGLKYAATKDIPSAVQELERAIELDPAQTKNYIRLGGGLLLCGKEG